jgi:hypothetical protein
VEDGPTGVATVDDVVAQAANGGTSGARHEDQCPRGAWERQGKSRMSPFLSRVGALKMACMLT